MFKRNFFNINIIERRKFLIVRINKEDIVIRFYINYSGSKMSQHSVANEKIVVLSLWREESIYRLCELTLA